MKGKKNVYTPEEMFADLYQVVFKGSLQGRNLSLYERMTQKNFIDAIIVSSNKAVEKTADEGLVKHIKSRSETGEFDFFYKAPVLIAVCDDPEQMRPAEDCAIALENMFLAAYDEGLGTCWINQLTDKSDAPEIHSVLTSAGMKDGYRVYGCCALGYAAVKPELVKPKTNEIIIC